MACFIIYFQVKVVKYGHSPETFKGQERTSLVLLRFLLLILINEILTLERARYPYSDVPLGEKLPQLVGTRTALGLGPWTASHI